MASKLAAGKKATKGAAGISALAGGPGGKAPGKMGKQLLSSSKLVASSKAMTGSVARISAVNAGMGMGMAGDEYSDQPRVVQKPDKQLDLTDKELNEEITRVLKADNPHAPENIARFDYKESAYKLSTVVDQLAVHFELQSNLIHVESDEAVRQMERAGEEEEPPSSATTSTSSATTSSATQSASGIGTQASTEAGDGEDDTGEAEPGSAETDRGSASEAKKPSARKKKLMNQFNFSERASLTHEIYMRSRETQTEPPPREVYSGMVNQAEIYDAYVSELERQQREKDAKERKKAGGRDETNKKRGGHDDIQFGMSQHGGHDDCTPVTNAAKIMERMVNQNICDELAQDFKYYEDPLDEKRKPHGTLMPLWKFTYDGTRRKTVTALAQNPLYSDLFVAGYGSHDFHRPADQGLVCFFSLKNPSFPEYVFKLISGITALDVHPRLTHLVAVGLYDGSVAIIDCTKPVETQPSHFTTIRTGKHLEPVWQVRWQKEDAENRLNFFSVSPDGFVCSWTIVQDQLERKDIVKLLMLDLKIQGSSKLKLDTADVNNPINLGSGSCFDFHPTNENVFLVGTEEGVIHKCSKTYSSKFLHSFNGHLGPIYTISWNPFQPRVFASCGADWTVRLWDDEDTSSELYKFHLREPVTDVAWAPYSSTVFATCTQDGKVSQEQPLCCDRKVDAVVCFFYCSRLDGVVTGARGRGN